MDTMGSLSEKVERFSEVGQTISVNLMWRGQLYRLQMFFPGAKFPTREEVTKQVQGIYPNAVVQTVYPSATDPTKPTIRVAKEGWTAKYKKSIDCDNPKGFSQRAHCQGRKKMAEEKDHEVSMAHSQLDKTIENARKLKKKLGTKEKNLPAWVQAKITDTDHNMDAASSYTEEIVSEEGLRDWFGKSKSKDGKKGWVNVVTGDSCASDKPGEGIPKCVSSAKRASMSKKERRAAAAAKRREDPGQQRKSGAAAPTMVKTDRKKKTKKEELELLDAYGETFAVIQDIVKPEPMKREEPQIDLSTHDIEAMTEAKDKKGKGSGTKDACYHKVKSRYSVWPSAYASGALVKCRKVGAANWGNSKEDYSYELNDDYYNTLFEKCWKGYEKKGMKTMFGKRYPNCVKKEETELEEGGGFIQVGDQRVNIGNTRSSSQSTQRQSTPLPRPSAAQQQQMLQRYNQRRRQQPTTTSTPRPTPAATPSSTPSRTPSRNYGDIGNPMNLGGNLRFIRDRSAERNRILQQLRQGYEPEGQLIDEEEYDKLKDKRLGGYDEKEDNNMETELDGIANRINAIRKSIKTKKKPTTQTEGAAWTKKAGKSESGGLNEKGRKSYERENPGSDLKAPSKKVGNKRRASFCARMKGMKKKLTSAKTANDPDSRINKSLRAWNC